MLFSKKTKQEILNLEQKVEALTAEKQSLLQEIQQLKAENQNLTNENKRLNETYAPLIQAESGANGYRIQLEKNAVNEYNLQFERLKAFIARWQASLPESKADTPENKKRLALTKLLSGILQESTPVCDLQSGAFTVERLNDAIGGKNIDGESTFDLDAVLNPSTDLDLEALCKELGVMD